MPHDPVTPAQFKTAKPQFAGVSDPVIQSYLGLAGVYVGQEWPDTLYAHAIIAVACHLMTLDGRGTDAASLSYASGDAEFQTIRSGNVSLTRFRDAAVDAGWSTVGWFNQTPCGRQFVTMLRMVKSGPRVAIGAIHPVSPYAKDAWW